MQRMKMALGIVVGAVLLQLAFMACSGNTPGIMGGSDAAAQTTTACTQWEVQVVTLETSSMPTRLEVGWEPFAAYTTSAVRIPVRRCVAR